MLKRAIKHPLKQYTEVNREIDGEEGKKEPANLLILTQYTVCDFHASAVNP